MDKRIIVIARAVREKVAEWTRHNNMVDEDLCGACAIASYTLWKCLRSIGYKADLVLGLDGIGGHCWVQIKRTGIDLTATQFRITFPEVFVFDVRNPIYFYRAKEFRTNEDAVSEISKWEAQSPLIYMRKIKRFIAQQRKSYAAVST